MMGDKGFRKLGFAWTFLSGETNKKSVYGVYFIINDFKCNCWPYLHYKKKKKVWLSFKMDSVAFSDNDSVKEQV